MHLFPMGFHHCWAVGVEETVVQKVDSKTGKFKVVILMGVKDGGEDGTVLCWLVVVMLEVSSYR